GRDKRGVVVDLLCCVSQSNWIGENVQSYEPENTLVQLIVFCDEHTFHETHVRLKRQCIGESRTSSTPADSVQSYEALEVRNLRWFVQGCQGSCSRLSWVMVNENAQR